jgi:hypothetical protein
MNPIPAHAQYLFPISESIAGTPKPWNWLSKPLTRATPEPHRTHTGPTPGITFTTAQPCPKEGVRVIASATEACDFITIFRGPRSHLRLFYQGFRCRTIDARAWLAGLTAAACTTPGLRMATKQVASLQAKHAVALRPAPPPPQDESHPALLPRKFRSARLDRTPPWTALLTCCALATCAVRVLGDPPKTVSQTYKFDAPFIETNVDCARVTLPGCGQLHRIGEPALPFRTARLVIPPGFAAGKAMALPSAEPVVLNGKWHVEFAGEPHSRPGRGKGDFAWGINRLIYGSDALYPPSPAELISVQRLAGYDIALVRVFPVRYRPASGQLLYSPEVQVQLDLVPASANAGPPVCPPIPGQAVSRVREFVDNPALLALLAPPSAAGTNGQALDYLLITSSNLASAFQPLLDWKLRQGLGVELATLEAITNSVQGRDVPEMIRNYIRNTYRTHGISYVLLGGATSVVPCRYAFVQVDMPAKDSYVPCDLYYGCLDGSWNASGDRHWGEPTDGENGGDVDLLAEVFVGRAPVTTVDQVKTFVEKTIRYETQGNTNLTNALLMAAYLGEFPTGPCHGAEMFNPLLPILDGWQLSRLDDGTKRLPQWSTPEAVAALNRSPHIVLYNGHGSADILMRMRTTDLTRLTNESPFLACSVGCSAAEFDHSKFWPDSFGETLVNGSSHGAFAAILNARVGWFDPQYPWKYSGEFQVKLFEQLLLRGHSRLGLANQQSKEELVGHVETAGVMTYRWCYYGITLLGDPHLPFHTPNHRPDAQAAQLRLASAADGATGATSGSHPLIQKSQSAPARPNERN